MSTLADELLQDFEDSGSEGEGDDNAHLFTDPEEVALSMNGNATGFSGASEMELDGDEEAVDEDDEMAGIMSGAVDATEDEEMTKAKVEKMQLGGVDDVRSVAGLMKTLEPVLEKIAHFQSLPPDKQTTFVGSVEDNPEYHLLTQANTLSTSIDSEIILVHKFIRDHYSIRFPELETLVTNPLDYAKVVTIIGNGPMDSENIKTLQTSKDNRLGATLRSVLDGPSVMIVTVEATTTKGREMLPRELERVFRACDMTLALDRAKKTLTDYVQSRMNLFAPNLTALIGSLTAAQLLNFAGGLTGLAKTPACNLPPLGSNKSSGTGFATNVGVRQQGFLYHSPIIQGISNDLKKQAMRIVSAKVVLAARVDRVHSSPDGSTGEELKEQCITRLEKLTEPPPNKGARALPAPDDKPARKHKTEWLFGKEEKEVGYGTGDGTKGMGMIGQGNDGRIRNIQIDQRTKAKLSAKNKGWGTSTPMSGSASSLRGFGQSAGNIDLRGKGLRASGVGGLSTSTGASAGTASSLAFTPVQGLELVDPKRVAEMKRKRAAEEDKWFKGGTFTQVGNGGGDNSMGPPPPKKVDSGTGKMGPPALPKK
ncbi:hypothetical protein DID88_002285 [Monilinia fructigena]|uniref:Nop domain-containing protein n=1 Tax=Monilinia fructigena TaxID=38457 RepID=A0A395IIL2_9HELO|nr:hypothetical protein DID88_002285 [Monilinia fructigena]